MTIIAPIPFVNTEAFPVTGVQSLSPIIDFVPFTSTAFVGGPGDNLLFSPFPSTAIGTQVPLFTTDPFPTTDFGLAIDQIGVTPFAPTAITTTGPQITSEFVPNVFAIGAPQPVPLPAIDVKAAVGTPTPIPAQLIELNAQVPQPVNVALPPVEGNAAVPAPAPIANPQININAPVGTPVPVALPPIETNTAIPQAGAITQLPEITFGGPIGGGAQGAALPQLALDSAAFAPQPVGLPPISASGRGVQFDAAPSSSFNSFLVPMPQFMSFPTFI